MTGSKEKRTGGPAFPGEFVQFESGEIGNNVAIKALGEGMTLRDYFAAKALPTMISMCQYADGEWDAGTVAQNAYALADAMLAERAQ